MDEGATALFGEKYGDRVRVISFGGTYSMELCGGTHVAHTGQIGFFRVISESAVASGIRRIEAVCGAHAEAWVEERLQQLDKVKVLFKNPVDLWAQASKNLEELAQLRKKMDEWEQRRVDNLVQEAQKEFEAHPSGSPFLVKIYDLRHADSLKSMATKLRSYDPKAIVVLGSLMDGRFHVALACGEALSPSLNAGHALRALLGTLGGQGGGQAHLAMGSAEWPTSKGLPQTETLKSAFEQALLSLS
jgi:alanyl-tRNA synthetase